MSKRSKILTKLKIIIVLFSISFISLSLLFFLIFLIKDIPIISLLVKDYIKGGKSLFLPFIPIYNLFIFTPESLPPIRYTIGHLLDMMILINFYFYLESIVYHYIKSAYIKEDLIYVRSPVLQDTDFITIFNDPYRENQEVLEALRGSQDKRERFLNIKDEIEDSSQIRGKNIYQTDREGKLDNSIPPFRLNKSYLIFKADSFIALFSIILLKYPILFSLSKHSYLSSNVLGTLFIMNIFNVNFKNNN